MDLGLPRGPIGKDVFFSRQGPARIWGRPIPSSEVLFVCFLYRRGGMCWRSLLGVVSENAALSFEKEGVFSLWVAGRIHVFPGCDVRA